MIYKDIKISSYDPLWAKQFQDEKALITQALSDHCVGVYHVGSTSIPGILAKPQIDIMAVIQPEFDPTDCIEKAGFFYRGEWNIPMKYGFSKNKNYKVNLHIFHDNHPEIEPQLLFPTYLRANPSVRDAYAALKTDLLKDENSKYKKDHPIFSGYTLGKHEFICQVLKDAGYKGLRVVKAAHHLEWQAVKRFREKYYMENYGQPEDLNAWTLKFMDHSHFILYEGMEIAGYAHLEIRPKGHVKEWMCVTHFDYIHHHTWFQNFLDQWIEFKTGKVSKV